MTLANDLASQYKGDYVCAVKTHVACLCFTVYFLFSFGSSVSWLCVVSFTYLEVVHDFHLCLTTLLPLGLFKPRPRSRPCQVVSAAVVCTCVCGFLFLDWRWFITVWYLLTFASSLAWFSPCLWPSASTWIKELVLRLSFVFLLLLDPRCWALLQQATMETLTH